MFVVNILFKMIGGLLVAGGIYLDLLTFCIGGTAFMICGELADIRQDMRNRNQ